MSLSQENISEWSHNPPDSINLHFFMFFHAKPMENTNLHSFFMGFSVRTCSAQPTCLPSWHLLPIFSQLLDWVSDPENTDTARVGWKAAPLCHNCRFWYSTELSTNSGQPPTSEASLSGAHDYTLPARPHWLANENGGQWFLYKNVYFAQKPGQIFKKM